MNMKVFLCGPRKGTKNQWSKSFNLTETKVRVMGYGVFNPAWFRFDTSWSDDDITGIYIQCLSFCDVIYLIDCWECDEQARKVYNYAVKNCKIIVHSIEELRKLRNYKGA